MKSLILAEKPSVGRDIARVLGCAKKGNGCLEGSRYIVTWALGHLITLADPEDYDSRYKEWKLSLLPMLPEKMQLVVIRQTGSQYRAVKNLLGRKDISEIIIATDAGREGELVARWILEKAGCKKKIKRLWISSVTDKAIRDGFSNLKNGHLYDDLYAAAACRAEADWLVGINTTRALTCKYNAQLSCGRVQTPTLAIIARREEEIQNFNPREYYQLSLHAGNIRWNWQDKKSGSNHSFRLSQLEAAQKRLDASPLIVEKVKKEQKNLPAPGLFDLTELQREANRRFGFSAKETLNICQRLYENHKVLTYPRTDSRYIGTDIVDTLKDRLRACSVGVYKKLAAPLITKPLRVTSSFVNDKKVSDHHAIIPTEQFVQMEYMTNEEKKIYDLVVRRFLSVLYPPSSYEQLTLKAIAGGENFIARGKNITSPGWKTVYSGIEDSEFSEQQLPSVSTGDQFSIDRISIQTEKTKPPAHFNEATLLSAMEDPVRYMSSNDQAAAKTLHETGGLGTVATRADIIDKLFNSFLLEKRGNDIFLTSKAKQLLALVPEDLKKPELTADWEYKLSQIANGNLSSHSFIKEIRAYASSLVDEVKGAEGVFHHDNLTNKPCPLCGKKMLSVKGKSSKLLVCQDRECGHRETISRTSNARCPNCHRKLELYVGGKEETFICSTCGYKEKLSVFKARREKEGAGVKKRDVQRYMQQQKKETAAPVNQAFAAALARLNQDKDN